MRTKNPNPASLLSDHADDVIRLYFEINHLKQLYRQGWLEKGRDVPESKCESVADHVFGMAVLALIVCDTYGLNVNRSKVLTMILIHEFGEVRDGDRFVQSEPDKRQRHEAERAAIEDLLKNFPQRVEYIALWEEFEQGETPEAQLARELDKLEMVLQSKIYSLQYASDLSEFADSAKVFIQTERMKELFAKIEEL
jgi:putative hydrolase of HD superfamily